MLDWWLEKRRQYVYGMCASCRTAQNLYYVVRRKTTSEAMSHVDYNVCDAHCGFMFVVAQKRASHE